MLFDVAPAVSYLTPMIGAGIQQRERSGEEQESHHDSGDGVPADMSPATRPNTAIGPIPGEKHAPIEGCAGRDDIHDEDVGLEAAQAYQSQWLSAAL